MAFADPQSVTIGTTPGTVSLPRTGQTIGSGQFTSADGTVVQTINHTYGNRTRRQYRLDYSKITTDPLQTGINIRVKQSAWLVIDTPPAGFSVTEQQDLIKALVNALSATSFAAVTKLVGGES